jgi:hypothetical protein
MTIASKRLPRGLGGGMLPLHSKRDAIVDRHIARMGPQALADGAIGTMSAVLIVAAVIQNFVRPPRSFYPDWQNKSGRIG